MRGQGKVAQLVAGQAAARAGWFLAGVPMLRVRLGENETGVLLLVDLFLEVFEPICLLAKVNEETVWNFGLRIVFFQPVGPLLLLLLFNFMFIHLF